MINLTLERCVPLTETGLEGCLSQGILVASRCLRRQGNELFLQCFQSENSLFDPFIWASWSWLQTLTSRTIRGEMCDLQAFLFVSSVTEPQGISTHRLSLHCCTVIYALVTELECEGRSLPQAMSSHLFSISQLNRVKLKGKRRKISIQCSFFGDKKI